MKKTVFTCYFLCTASVLIFAATVLNLFNILYPEMMAHYLINNWTVWRQDFELGKSIVVNESTVGSVCTFVPLGVFCLYHSFKKDYSRKSALHCLILGMILSMIGILTRAMFVEDIHNYYYCSDTWLQLSVIDKVSSGLMVLNVVSVILFGCTAGVRYFVISCKKEET